MLRRTALSLAGLMLITACADHDGAPVAPVAPALLAKPSASATQVFDGTTGPGSLYRVVVPDNWNGALIVYAHGYVFHDQPVALPAEADLFVQLLAPHGIALAYSSFSENGWNVKDGAQRTHQLLGLFTSKFSAPNRVYIGGVSMGGLIAIKLVESYPRTFAGALAACAVAGGTRQLFEYHAHVRALFDVLYPGVLPGNAASLPPGTDVNTEIILPAIVAMTANPTAAFTLAAMDQAPIPFTTPAELVQSIVTALQQNADDLADQVITKGKPYFENRNTVYSSALLPAIALQAINASIGRFSASPAALAALDHNYTPSGDLRIPMLMLSNAADPVVPGFNQASYLADVTAKGADNLLVQRQVPTYGHCVFTPTEIATALFDLFLWTEAGIKPTP